LSTSGPVAPAAATGIADWVWANAAPLKAKAAVMTARETWRILIMVVLPEAGFSRSFV
jgi:hypothetical protein